MDRNLSVSYDVLQARRIVLEILFYDRLGRNQILPMDRIPSPLSELFFHFFLQLRQQHRQLNSAVSIIDVHYLQINGLFGIMGITYLQTK
ncbi:MAG: hypothetical protein ACE3JK_11935 [Sporolactobacillus sp.]